MNVNVFQYTNKMLCRSKMFSKDLDLTWSNDGFSMSVVYFKVVMMIKNYIKSFIPGYNQLNPAKNRISQYKSYFLICILSI